MSCFFSHASGESFEFRWSDERKNTAGRTTSPPASPPASILSPPTSPAEFLSSPYLAQLHLIIHILLLALDRAQRNLVMVCMVQGFARFTLRR